MTGAPLDEAALRACYRRCFVIQGSWNYHTMLGSGFAYAMLPALERIFADDPEALEASVQRHLEHFNAHPYLSGMAVGAAVRLEADGTPPEVVRRFKTAVRGPLGGLGDALVWASWLPAVSLAALVALWLGLPGWLAALLFLVIYNAGHLALRSWAFREGLREGRGVAAVLGRVGLGAWTDRIRTGGTLLLGLLAGLVVASPDGLVGSGALWALLGVVAFLAGEHLGHRVWRPAAAGVVAVVLGLSFWGALVP